MCPTFDHRDIKKKKSFQVSCQVYPGLDNKYSCGIEQPLGHGKHPKREYKNTILPRARATFKDKQKRGFNNSSESCQQLVGPWPQMECKPYFYPAKSRRKWDAVYISFWSYLGVPNWIVVKPSSLDTKQEKQEGNSCLWKRKDQQPVRTWKQIHESQFKDLILIHVFPANLNLKKKGCEILPTSFNQAL